MTWLWGGQTYCEGTRELGFILRAEGRDGRALSQGVTNAILEGAHWTGARCP